MPHLGTLNEHVLLPPAEAAVAHAVAALVDLASEHLEGGEDGASDMSEGHGQERGDIGRSREVMRAP